VKTVELSVLTAGAVGLVVLTMSIVAPASTGLAARILDRGSCSDGAWSAGAVTCAALATAAPTQ
jgi:hypothetical protein